QIWFPCPRGTLFSQAHDWPTFQLEETRLSGTAVALTPFPVSLGISTADADAIEKKVRKRLSAM
ncbi:MAG: hypothetical protein WBM36_15695, partial [Lysobacterales bacterium]